MREHQDATSGPMRRVILGALAGAALLLGSCRDKEEGAVTVTVIGSGLKLVDPAAGVLTAPQQVLIANAAQGLVRFDAQGNIEPGLAERWNVSDDGLSYIFRLKKGEWPGGREIRAQDVARMLRRQLQAGSRNPLKDTFGAVAEIVAMTDRVIEIRLSAPRPHLLQLLAQPEFGLVRNGQGSGPFEAERDEGSMALTRDLPAPDGGEPATERVTLTATAGADEAVKAFVDGRTELVLGGTFADLGTALGANLPRGSLRFDPVAGLFGLIPARGSGPAADAELRGLLDRAIDRQAMVAALGVPDLEPRASILQPGLDGVAAPFTPEWATVPLGDRREQLIAEAQRIGGDAEEPLMIRVAVPEGPGGQIVLQRLRTDWGALGFQVEPAARGAPADFRFVDAVAPSLSPAWFLRTFRCEVAPVCVESADELLQAARLSGSAQQRNAFFAEAERQLREATVFMPIAAPVRWSLVDRRVTGFAENRFARHTLTGLREQVRGRRN